MAKLSFNCWSCGRLIELEESVTRSAECPHCRADLHCCKNCRFYDPKAYNECHEPSADVVQEKERANFCEYFEAGAQHGSRGPGKEDLFKAAEELFKKK